MQKIFHELTEIITTDIEKKKATIKKIEAEKAQLLDRLEYLDNRLARKQRLLARGKTELKFIEKHQEYL